MPDAKDFALKHRVLLLRHGIVDVDVSFGAIDFEHRAAARATRHRYAPGVELTTCLVEDLVVFKAFASRGQDWVDIESIIKPNGDKLDWRIIESELLPVIMLKEQPEILDRLMTIREKALHLSLRLCYSSSRRQWRKCAGSMSIEKFDFN